jgi:hypothetical protein
MLLAWLLAQARVLEPNASPVKLLRCHPQSGCGHMLQHSCFQVLPWQQLAVGLGFMCIAALYFVLV